MQNIIWLGLHVIKLHFETRKVERATLSAPVQIACVAFSRLLSIRVSIQTGRIIAHSTVYWIGFIIPIVSDTVSGTLYAVVGLLQVCSRWGRRKGSLTGRGGLLAEPAPYTADSVCNAVYWVVLAEGRFMSHEDMKLSSNAEPELAQARSVGHPWSLSSEELRAVPLFRRSGSH